MTNESDLRTIPQSRMVESRPPARSILRGLERLASRGLNMERDQTTWIAKVVWEPEWLALIHEAPEEPSALHDVFAINVKLFGDVVEVEGMSMCRETGFTCRWRSSNEWTLELFDKNWESWKTINKGSSFFAHEEVLPDDAIHGESEKRLPIGRLSEQSWSEYGELQSSPWPLSYARFLRYLPMYEDTDGALVVLPALAGPWHAVRDANARSVIVGGSMTADGRLHAVRWVNGRLQILPSPFPESCATHINDAGQIAGWGRFIEQLDGKPTRLARYGLIWTADGVCHTVSFVPLQMSDAGVVIGQDPNYFDENTYHELKMLRSKAFVWVRGKEYALPVQSPYNWSEAQFVSENDEIVGRIFTEAEVEDEKPYDLRTDEIVSLGSYPDTVACVWKSSSKTEDSGDLS